MSDYLEKYNDYCVGILILGYAKRYAGTNIMINKDVCSICIQFVAVPYSSTLKYPDGLESVMDKIHIILLYKTTTPLEWRYANARAVIGHNPGGAFSKIAVKNPKRKPNDVYKGRNFEQDMWVKLKKSTLLPIHCSMQRIKDQKLVNAILMFVRWRIGDWHQYLFKEYYLLYTWIDVYFNAVIDMFKKWVGLRCKYMVELIEVYEYYYWCHYVTTRVETKGWVDRLNYIWKKSVRFRLDLDRKGWNDWDQMYLSALLETIFDEYEDEADELMSGLDVVLDFVRAKYEMMAKQIDHVPWREVDEEIYALLHRN